MVVLDGRQVVLLHGAEVHLDVNANYVGVRHVTVNAIFTMAKHEAQPILEAARFFINNNGYAGMTLTEYLNRMLQ